MSEYTSMQMPEEMKKSKYNSAIAQLYRLDALWQDAHRHAREFNYTKWNEDLERVWMELSADSGKEYKGQIKILNEKLYGLLIYAGLSLLKNKNPALYAKIYFMQRKFLIEKEELLHVCKVLASRHLP